MKRLAFTLIVVGVLLGFSSHRLEAEAELSAELTSSATAWFIPDVDPLFFGGVSARLSAKSTGNSNVQGEFTISGNHSYSGSQERWISSFDIYRAFIQTDFPAIRFTMGKTRLTWGDGIFFNAGDRLYGSSDLNVQLTADTLRDDSRWSVATYIPFGLFNFVELVALANEQVLEKIDAGGRIVGELGSTKLEAGYYLDGKAGRHEPYVSFQGNLLLDWHLSAATSINADDLVESSKDGLEISTGLSYTFYLEGGHSVSTRLEGLVRPFRSWEEMLTTSIDEADRYGLLLYPEINWSTNTTSLALNGFYSPVDNSAIVVLSWKWNVFQGLKLLASAGVSIGDESDLFETGVYSASIGANYIY